MSKPKLCYVIPEYNSEAHTHFAYLTPFIRALSETFDIWLVVERGTAPPDMGTVRVSVARMRIPLLRLINIKFLLFWARVSGYKDFYVHYSFFSAYVASVIARVTGGRVFYWNCGEPWKYKRNFFREAFERTVYSLVTYLVTGTEGMKQAYAKHYGLSLEKIKVMPNWVDISNIKSQIANLSTKDIKKELNISKDTKIILFAHRLSKRKGAHYLPEIIKALQNENVVLLIAGDGPEKENIQLQITNYPASPAGGQLQNRVQFLGWVPQKDTAQYFAIADVFILPSEEEGFPHVILESMAYGVPSVAFNVGGVKEIILPELLTYVVAPGDTAEFIRKVNTLLDISLEKRNSLQARMNAWIRKYDLLSSVSIFKKIAQIV
jgi:glycosyltransferase involved in cell wall biosynthesis